MPRICLLFIVFAFLSFPRGWATNLLPIDFRDAYETLDALPSSSYTTRTIWPYSCEKVLALDSDKELPHVYRDMCAKRGVFAIRALELSGYYHNSSDAFSLVLDKEGQRLREGVNAFFTMSLGGRFGSNLGYFLQARARYGPGAKEVELHRGYLDLKLGKFLFLAGKDNVKVGPSRFGGLLSGLTSPFWQVRVQTAEPLRFLGLWDLLAMRAWLLEDRRDHSDPGLLFFRVCFKPSRYLEFGVNRATLYGGKGRPGYALWEYPRLILGQEENVPGSKYDNDAFLGYDISVDLPLRPFDLFRLYYEKEATDVKTPLQKGEKFEFDLPFVVVKLYEGASTFGLLVKKAPFSFRGEVTLTKGTMYLHHAYPHEGFSYKGIPLGYPYGRDVLHIAAQIRYQRGEDAIEVEMGFIEQPLKEDLEPVKELNRYYLGLSLEKRHGNFGVSPFLRVDLSKGENLSETPLHYELRDRERLIFTLGLRLSYFF